MTARARTRLAPGGSAIPLAVLARVLFAADAGRALDRALQTRFAGRRLTYHASGREAMRVALALLAERSGRNEVAIPAYGCFSIPASVVAAGLKVRLVDVDDEGRLSPEAVERIPFERVAAVVVGNLFGLPEPVTGLAARAREAGTALIDDAAQALGATAADGVVGARGDVGILSFGRGKPLSALGGGAAIWPDGDLDSRVDREEQTPPRARP
ncbi:aminotransferase class V-fold PLP-dependent enzyme, partial [Myxococcota bacterium]|nr:aminotransferase class V-fold PLP-dependent enzyme [Myxococcota bacterium]